jgi:hypothetical protein
LRSYTDKANWKHITDPIPEDRVPEYLAEILPVTWTMFEWPEEHSSPVVDRFYGEVFDYATSHAKALLSSKEEYRRPMAEALGRFVSRKAMTMLHSQAASPEMLDELVELVICELKEENN